MQYQYQICTSASYHLRHFRRTQGELLRTPHPGEVTITSTTTTRAGNLNNFRDLRPAKLAHHACNRLNSALPKHLSIILHSFYRFTCDINNSQPFTYFPPTHTIHSISSRKLNPANPSPTRFRFAIHALPSKRPLTSTPTCTTARSHPPKRNPYPHSAYIRN